MFKRNRLTVLLLLPVLCTLFLSGLFLPISAQTQAEKEISLSGEDWSFSVPKTTNVYHLEKSLGQELRMYLEKPTGQDYVIFPLNYEGVKLYKQLPLDKELDLKQYSFVNSTHAVNEKGEIVVYRPENIVNSYAVYSEKTGQKVAHIYRSAVFDAKGQRQYVDMEISKAGIKVYLPTEWVNDINRYPLTVDPTFGYTTIGSSSTSGNMNRCQFVPFTLTEAGNVTSINVYLSYETTWITKVKTAIYNQSTNYPDSLLAYSEEKTVSSSINSGPDWLQLSISGGINLDAGTYYLTLWQEGLVNYYFDSGLNRYHIDSESYSSFPETAWVGMATEDRKVSIYAEYNTDEPEPTATPTPTPTPLPTNEEGYVVFELLLLTDILVVINIVGLGFRVPLLNLVALIFSFTFIIIFEVSNMSILLIAINCLVSVACLLKNLYGRKS